MNQKHVLLIEDNVDDEQLMLRALRKHNVMNEVIVAYEGREGLDYLFGAGGYEGRDTSIKPSLILLDLRLPDLSGIEVLREIRANPNTSLIPVVVITSTDEDRIVCEAYAAGANSFVRKPASSSEYADMILQLMLYWLLLNVAPPDGVRVV